jgi:hypothetical protein
MITSAPVQATLDLANVRDKISAFITVARLKAQGGVTISEFAELAIALLRIVMQTIDEMPQSGVEKKALALDAVAMLFDAVADKCIPTLAYPVWLIVRPAVRSLVLLAADGAIESLLPLVRMSRP